MARKAATSSVYRQLGTYERLRRRLLDAPDDGRLDRQLSYWVLPTDRRLPIAFLDRELRTLLDKPFDTLVNTPGVGQKKIEGFFELLRRAAKTEADENGTANGSITTAIERAGFDPTRVSEGLWASWCETVRLHGFTEHALGRLAPTLRALPTVIWHTPLAEYADRTLAEIRGLRTHGEKRVHAILEVFCTIHEAVSTSARSESLEIELVPRFIPPLARWTTEALTTADAPSLPDLRRNLAQPLVQQISIDLGPQVAELATGRLGIGGASASVKQQAEQLGVTRARIYQLLEDCSRAMAVRWPEGRWLIAPLTLQCQQGTPAVRRLMSSIEELFYPKS